MRVELIGHFQPCMTDIYLHIDARMADYILTHPYTGDPIGWEAEEGAAFREMMMNPVGDGGSHPHTTHGVHAHRSVGALSLSNAGPSLPPAVHSERD